jgi:cell wall-associated NlpC family hydrolase
MAPGFAALLKAANAKLKPAPVQLKGGATFHADAPSGPVRPLSRREILATAETLMGIPYVWGGTTASGLDCSAFVSKAWAVPRQTTDTLASVSRQIAKDELHAGDALNLTTGRDPEGHGHVRLFDRWANAEHTRMYVYEQTPPKSIHHVVDWDPSYVPMRRANLSDV